MLDKGIYLARAMRWDLGQTSKGNEQVAIEFALSAPEHQGGTIWWYGYFTEGTWERTVQALRHMGWVGQDLATLDGLDANEVELVVDHEEYNGKVSAKVKWVNPVGGMAMKAPLDDQRKRAFAAQMKAKIAGLDAAASAGVKKPAASTSAAPKQSRMQIQDKSSGVLSPEPPPHSDFDAGF